MQMRSMKSAKKSACAVLITVMAMVCTAMWFAETAHAARPNEKVPNLTQSKTNFTLQVNYTDDEDTTPIDGVKLTIYKVAGVTVSDGYAKYPVESDFKDCGFKFTEMTADDSQVYADKAEEVVKSKGISGKTVVTNRDGKASFGELENGIYLVRQTGKEGTAKTFGTLSPWLVELPELCETEAGERYWNYDLTSFPKPFAGKDEGETPEFDTEEDEPDEEFGGEDEDEEEKFRRENEEDKEKDKKKDNPIEKLIKTGDTSSIVMFVVMLLIAAAGLVVVVVTRRRRR